jgi:membrane-associated protein
MIELIIEYLTDTHKLIEVGGLLAVMIVIYIETGFFVGLVLPGGDYVLFTVGLFCSSKFFHIPVYLVILLVIIAAVLGDFTGFTKGRWLGEKLFKKKDSRFFKQEYLVRSYEFYKKYGMSAFLIGRFLPIIRPLVPMTAGASGVELKKYIFFNILGGCIWVTSLITTGYLLGLYFPKIIHYSVWILIGFILLASSSALKILLTERKADKIKSDKTNQSSE